MEETKNIRVIMIFEIVGKPPEHLVGSLDQIIKSMDAEKGVIVKSKDIKEPHEIEEQKGFYTTFAEVEVEVEEIVNLAILIFKYMPAHIEIASPELIALTNNKWGDVFNELARRLHGYDEVARVLQMENSIMKKKLEELMGNQKSKPNTLNNLKGVKGTSKKTKKKVVKKTKKKKISKKK